MTHFELKQIYLELEHQIMHLWLNETFAHKEAARADAQDAISELKPEIDVWVALLNTREISCYDLEKLLDSRKDHLRLSRLIESGLEIDQIETMRGDVLRMIAKAIMSSYLNSFVKVGACATIDGIVD